MKRDYDLVRRLLLKLESELGYEEGISSRQIQIDKSTVDQINYHIDLLHDAGMIEGIKSVDAFGTQWLVERLTWNAHEFIDSTRNDTIWKRVKDKVIEKGGSVPFNVLQQFIGAVLQEQLK